MIPVSNYVPALERVRAAVRDLSNRADHREIAERAMVDPGSVGMFLIEMGARPHGRPPRPPEPPPTPVVAPDIVVDLDGNKLIGRDGRSARLTAREAEVAFAICQAAPNAISRGEIFSAVFGTNPEQEYVRGIDNYMTRLRPKFVRVGARLDTVRGRGWRLVAEKSP